MKIIKLRKEFFSLIRIFIRIKWFDTSYNFSWHQLLRRNPFIKKNQCATDLIKYKNINEKRFLLLQKMRLSFYEGRI